MCLADPPRHAGAVRRDALRSGRRAGSRRRRSAGRRRRRCAASRSSSSSRPPGRPSAFHARTTSVIVEHGLLAVAEHGGVDEVGDRLGVERGVPAGERRSGASSVAVGGVQRDAGQVERGEQVGVAELGGEATARARRRPPTGRCASTVNCGTPCSRISASRSGHTAYVRSARTSSALVEHLVEDHDALVGQADLVGVRVHQRPADVGRVPVLDRGVQLAADVLDRLAAPGRASGSRRAKSDSTGMDPSLRQHGRPAPAELPARARQAG